MAYQHPDFILPVALLEQIAEQGFDALPELMRIVINEAMRLERQQYLGVAPYRRLPECRGHGNGFKEHTERTRPGAITFAVPQVRESGFFPQAPEPHRCVALANSRAINPHPMIPKRTIVSAMLTSLL